LRVIAVIAGEVGAGLVLGGEDFDAQRAEIGPASELPAFLDPRPDLAATIHGWSAGVG
jgi:hypothetical protein